MLGHHISLSAYCNAASASGVCCDGTHRRAIIAIQRQG